MDLANSTRSSGRDGFCDSSFFFAQLRTSAAVPFPLSLHPPLGVAMTTTRQIISRTVGPNPLRPELLSTNERLSDLAEILALGLMRLRARKSSQLSAETGESSLHFMPAESGHTPMLSPEVGE